MLPAAIRHIRTATRRPSRIPCALVIMLGVKAKQEDRTAYSVRQELSVRMRRFEAVTLLPQSEGRGKDIEDVGFLVYAGSP